MPAVTFNFSDDFEQCYFNTEPIKFTSARRMPGDSGDEVLISPAKRRAISKRELMSANGAYTGQDINWWFPQKSVPDGITPKPGDTIIDQDEVVWTVLETQLGKHGQTWKCVCRNLSIAYDLRDLITIELAGPVFDATGTVKRAWPTEGGKVLYNNLACRVQPNSANIVTERGIQGEETTYTIIVSRQLHLFDLRECRIRWTTSRDRVDKYLDAVSYTEAERITDLPKIEAKLKVQ